MMEWSMFIMNLLPKKFSTYPNFSYNPESHAKEQQLEARVLFCPRCNSTSPVNQQFRDMIKWNLNTTQYNDKNNDKTTKREEKKQKNKKHTHETDTQVPFSKWMVSINLIIYS